MTKRKYGYSFVVRRFVLDMAEIVNNLQGITVYFSFHMGNSLILSFYSFVFLFKRISSRE